MAFPPTLIDDSRSATRQSTPTRFLTRRRGLRQRHNPNVDAAWWPRSSNLTEELTDLLRAARETGFDATAVAYRIDDAWIATPRHVEFGAREVKVSGYHNHHRGMVTLVDGLSHQRLQVMVVPPDTPAPLATRALRIAAHGADPMHGADILALARGEIPTATVRT